MVSNQALHTLQTFWSKTYSVCLFEEDSVKICFQFFIPKIIKVSYFVGPLINYVTPIWMISCLPSLTRLCPGVEPLLPFLCYTIYEQSL